MCMIKDKGHPTHCGLITLEKTLADKCCKRREACGSRRIAAMCVHHMSYRLILLAAGPMHQHTYSKAAK